MDRWKSGVVLAVGTLLVLVTAGIAQAGESQAAALTGASCRSTSASWNSPNGYLEGASASCTGLRIGERFRAVAKCDGFAWHEYTRYSGWSTTNGDTVFAWCDKGDDVKSWKHETQIAT